jgi:hypothetical protein
MSAVGKNDPLTGRPTAILKHEIVLLPDQSFTFPLYVNFGSSTLPYTVPANELESMMKIKRIYIYIERERERETESPLFYLLVVH